MVRRILFVLGLCLGTLGLLALGAGLWLVGRPLSASASPARGLGAPLESEDLVDLVPAPSTDIEGSGSVVPRREEEVLEAADLPGRTVPRTTPPLRNTLNILLVGVDRRPGARSGGRTDTILVAVLDRSSDHVGLVSVPRDLYVEFPGHGPARINAAYGIARETGQDGLALLARVASDTLAIPIHHAVAVDLDVFESSVDALGGVTVDVPCPIVDNFVDPREPTGRRRLDVAAGRQHMDGVTAAMYARSRHGRSDWDRARRQQALLLGLRARLRTASGLARLPALWDELGEDVVSDMTRLDLLRLAQRAARTDPEHVHGFVIGFQHTDHWTTPEGRWVLLPRYDAIDASLRALFSAPSPGARPLGATCPPADVALTRPDRERFRREHGRGASGRGEPIPALGRQPPSEPGSISSHSSSEPSRPAAP